MFKNSNYNQKNIFRQKSFVKNHLTPRKPMRCIQGSHLRSCDVLRIPFKRPTNIAIPPGNFEIPLRLNKWDLFGFFLNEFQPDLDHYSVKRSLHRSSKVWEHFKIARGYGTICWSLGYTYCGNRQYFCIIHDYKINS